MYDDLCEQNVSLYSYVVFAFNPKQRSSGTEMYLFSTYTYIIVLISHQRMRMFTNETSY